MSPRTREDSSGSGVRINRVRRCLPLPDTSRQPASLLVAEATTRFTGLRLGYYRSMRTAPWTYEMPPAGEGAAGLEDYQVKDAQGETVGNVAVVVERKGARYLVAEVGRPPLKKDRRAIPWDNIVGIAHERLAVTLAAGALEQALELDPENAVEDGPADARRVTDSTPAETRTGEPPRPIDSVLHPLAVAVGAATLVTLLGAIILISLLEESWKFAFAALPIACGVVFFFVFYRMIRKPYA
jgi:hypothetical protein